MRWGLGFVAAFFALSAHAQGTRAPASEPAAGQAAKPAGALECLIEPSMVVNVGSPVDGVIEQVLVDRGAQVTKGQVVARLQSGVEAAAVKLSEARVDYGKR